MMNDLLRTLAKWATERPAFTLLAIGILTVGAGWVAGGLEISTARTTLVSQDNPHWQRYMRFAEEFGIPEDLVVVVRGDDPNDVRRAVDAISDSVLKERDQVASVFHRIDLSDFSSRAPLYLGSDQMELLKRVATEPAVGALVSLPGAAARIDAISAMIRRAPQIWTKEVVDADFHAMSRVLKSLLAELARFAVAKGEAPQPTFQFDPEAVANAVGNPLEGSGLDASGYLTADDGKIAVVFVRPLYRADDLSVVRPFVAAVRAAVDRALAAHIDVSYGLTGIPASEVDEHTAVQEDTKLTTLVALIGVVCLFLVYFPNARLLLLSLAPVLVGVVWTAAATRLLFGYINLISSIFLVVLIGMGIDFSIHICTRFLELRAEGCTASAAAAETVLRAGRGIVTGGITSAGAFFAVGFSEFKGMAELGVVAGVGLTLTMLTALSVLPALLVLTGPRNARSRIGFPGFDQCVGKLVDYRTQTMLVMLILTIPMAWGIHRTEFDFSLIRLLPDGAESSRLMEEMIEKRELSSNAVVSVADTLEAASELEKAYKAKPTVYRAVSAATFLPRNQESRLDQIREIMGSIESNRAAVDRSKAARPVADAISDFASEVEKVQDIAFRRGDGVSVANLEESLESLHEVRKALKGSHAKQVEARLDAYTAAIVVLLEEGIARLQTTLERGPMTPDDLPSGVRERFISSSHRFAVYAFPKESIWDRDHLAAFIAETRTVDSNVTGFPETFYENSAVIQRGFYDAALYAAIAVIFMLLIDLRRVSYLLVAILPLSAGAIWMVGTMGLFDIRYNLANILSLPLIIGVGIDNGVHLLHRYAHCRDVRTTLSRTGGAVTLSSLTTMIGFGSLSLASHGGLRTLGIVLIVGVGSCLLTTLLFMPAGLSMIRRPTELEDDPEAT